MYHRQNYMLLGQGGPRQLLQEQQPVGGACQCECPSTEQHGVNPGWIALALFLGILAGCLSMLLVQCRRRRRELRYMDKAGNTATRQSLVMMQALPAAGPAASAGRHQQLGALPALPPSAPASVAGSARTAAAGAGPNQKYYSPLNSNKGHGSVVAALSELRTSLHYGSDNGGDTHSVAASDQHAPRDKGAAAPSQLGGAAGDSQRPREFSQHGMRGQAQQQQHSSGHGGAAGAAWGAPAQAQAAPCAGQQRHSEPEAMLQGSVVYGAVGAMLPQEVSSSMLSADGQPLLAEDSSPLPTSHAAAPQPSKHHAAGAAVAPSPRQQAQLMSSPVKGAAAAGSSPGVASTTTAGSAKSPAGATDIEDEYDESDLDEDWKALLGGVDARLKLQGARPLNARERAIAIKKLLVATGTRGVEFALNSTLQEVLRFRQIHGDAQ